MRECEQMEIEFMKDKAQSIMAECNKGIDKNDLVFVDVFYIEEKLNKMIVSLKRIEMYKK